MRKVLFFALLVACYSFSSNANADRLFDSQNNCFIENTKISLVGNKSINVQDIKKGTPLLGYSSTVEKFLDSVSMDAFPARLMTEEGDEQFIELQDSLGHKVTVSDNVPIFIINEGFAHVGKARVGDSVWTLDGTAKIVQVKIVKPTSKIFDFGMQPWNVLANKLDGFFAERILFGMSSLTGASVR